MMNEKQIRAIKKQSVKDKKEALRLFNEAPKGSVAAAINRDIFKMSQAEIDLCNKILKG